MKAAYEIDAVYGDIGDIFSSLSGLMDICFSLGQLRAAHDTAGTTVAFAESRGDAQTKCESRVLLAEVLTAFGDLEEAEVLFREAEAIQRANQRYGFLFSHRGFRFCQCLLAGPELAAWRIVLQNTHSSSLTKSHGNGNSLEQSQCRQIGIRASTTLDWAEREGLHGYAPILATARDHLTLARTSLYEAIFSASTVPFRLKPESISRAASHLDQAVNGLRRSGQLPEVPDGLLTHAWLYALKGDVDVAEANLDEAWDIASLGPMRLHITDVHLHRARLFFREKPYPWKSPQDDLAAAEKLINECGYHRRDEELADAKRAILSAG